MTPRWTLFTLGWLLVLVGAGTAHLLQTSGGVTVHDLRFSGSGGRTLSALLYLPPNATPATPAPAVLAVHGYINTREVQTPFALELARRGHVVLSLDQGGHGYSDPPAFVQGFGGPAALRYLRSLDVVDADNIGLTGHSMGGWTVLAAAYAMPDSYRSVVLHGSSTGPPFAAPGTAEWPRNVAVVFPRYDEFAAFMWEVERAQDVGQSPKLKALFGSQNTIVPGEIHGDPAAGTARILYAPAVTHPGAHLSHAAVGHTLDWFAHTLAGADAAQPDRQIWFAREVATLLALIGFVLLLLGSFRVWLGSPCFQPLAQSPKASTFHARTPRWWLLAIAGALIPVATFYPVFTLADHWLPASRWLPQAMTNQIALWALLNGGIVLILGALSRSRAVSVRHAVLPCVLIALASVGTAYLAVLLADFLFTVDFRFWFVGVKALSLGQFQAMLVYLPAFALFFLLLLRMLHGGLAVAGDSALKAFVVNGLLLAGGFAAFLLLQYGSLFTRGMLLTPSEPLHTIVMLQFVPLLLIVAIISTYTHRLTGSHVPGALTAALFVTGYIVASQATQYG